MENVGQTTNEEELLTQRSQFIREVIVAALAPKPFLSEQTEKDLLAARGRVLIKPIGQ